MDCFEMEGGRPLEGEVAASGSKNATLPLMAMSLLLDGESHFTPVPDLRDIDTMEGLLGELGVEVQREGEDARLQVRSETVTEAPYDIVRRMRASICVLGPLLARRGSARVPLPGGCVFGLRPVDLHVRGLRALGAQIEQENGFLVAEAPKDGLQGASIDLHSAFGSTVLGTVNVMAAACLAQGESVIRSAAREPEVVEVARFLRACGAKIEGEGTDRIQVQGVDRLKGQSWRVPADRIEAGTLLLAGAITRGRIRVSRCQPAELKVLLHALGEIGLEPRVEGDAIGLDATQGATGSLDLETSPYPGFPTDLQAQWMALATQLPGQTRIRERIYPERFMHVPELQRLGAKLERAGDTTLVYGGSRLTGAPVLASDLRASACLVMAGLVAHGRTLVRRVYHLDRGYAALEKKLNHLGAVVQRMPDPDKP